MKPLVQPREPDHAGVAFRPPLMLGLMLLLSFLGRWLVHLPIMTTPLAWVLGAIDILAAVGLFVWALRTMTGRGTTVPTDEPTSVIVTEVP